MEYTSPAFGDSMLWGSRRNKSRVRTRRKETKKRGIHKRKDINNSRPISILLGRGVSDSRRDKSECSSLQTVTF